MEPPISRTDGRILVWRVSPSVHLNLSYEPGVYIVPRPNRQTREACGGGYHFEPTINHARREWNLSGRRQYQPVIVFAEDVTVPHSSLPGHRTLMKSKARASTIIILDEADDAHRWINYQL